MNRILLFTFSAMVVAGCASSPRTKEREYEELQKNVMSLHDSSLVKDESGRLFTPKTVDVFAQNFAQSYCTPGVTAEDCTRNFDRAAASRLAEIYFAADTSVVAQTCDQEPIICDDLISLEVLFQRLHNSGIEKSKQEKLSHIEAWYQGKLTDDQLKAALHLDFKYENGKLVFRVPSA